MALATTNQSEVIFEITNDNLETGMRGYPVGYCPTSSVDPQKGLFYGPMPLVKVATREPEELIYSLMYGEEASAKQLDNFKKELKKRAKCKKETIEAIQRLPRELHPMKLLSCAQLILGGFEKDGGYREDCLRLIAKIPELVATVINHHAGWNSLKESRPELPYMENFTQMLNVPNTDPKKLTDIFKLFNVLHFDHGGGNLSAFVGKAVASGLEDMFGSLSAATSALAGPRHGKANQDCLEFVKSLVKELGDNYTEGQVEQAVRDKLANKELIYGFGHAVLRVEDPRATLQYDMAEKNYSDDPCVKMALHLRRAGAKVLGENKKVQNPFPNVDAISGTLLQAAGFDYPEYFTVLFGLSRMVGISIQIVYEREEARKGKGLAIVRPKYFFRSREGKR
ncbi:Probable citrate synthase 2, mitochondrial [Chlamydiales bacterium SCGC AB-751-O23]|jgi:citrate synthase|nr:Probable citrate synthase 2, mitochondrial [Chlamydiales bacterium SCGC AB-751-O23]